MNPGLSNTNPTLVAAFRAALLHQGLIVVALLAVLAVLWLAVRAFGPAARQGGALPWALAFGGTTPGRAPGGYHGPAPRRGRRIWFGTLAAFRGPLQTQPPITPPIPPGATSS